MRKRNVVFTLVLVVLLVTAAIVRWQASESVPREAFDRHPDRLEYTRHAKCRMDCRQITREDVEKIMRQGVILFSKSDMNDRPCPSFALQGFTDDGDNIRVIFAQCREETRVVTAYHLHREFDCECP